MVSVINAFDDWIVRAYCRGRFTIIRQRFLEEIGQYLPPSGRVLDLGCGFGLFSLYFASCHRDLRITGIDLNRNRIAMAQKAAATLGLTNVSYEHGNAEDFSGERRFDAIYMLDILHHLPPAAVMTLLTQLAQALEPHGRLIIKEVDAAPALKRWFTRALDWGMHPRGAVHYWLAATLQRLLEDLGFTVHRHAMIDFLPYPHVLYICERRP